MIETVEITPQNSTITVEVLLAGSGIEGPAGPGLPTGGTEFQMVEKASAIPYDYRFTNKPTVHGIQLDIANPLATLPIGALTWDTTHKVPKVHVGTDGAIALLGMDRFTGPVQNQTGGGFLKGQPMAFSGAVGGEFLAAKMIADGSIPGLYLIGIAAEDIANGSSGLVKVEGRLEGIDTTGTTSGEVWAQGDVLYVSPTVAGQLTEVKPSAPNIVAPVAAVLVAHATTGILSIRVIPHVDNFYGAFHSTTTQNSAGANTPNLLTFGVTDVAYGITVGTTPSRIEIANSGLYTFQYSMQSDKTSSSTDYFYIWVRKNGADIPSSTSRVAMSGNVSSTAITKVFTLKLAAGDYVELAWASPDATMHLDAEAASAWAPASPSARLTVSQTGL